MTGVDSQEDRLLEDKIKEIVILELKEPNVDINKSCDGFQRNNGVPTKVTMIDSKPALSLLILKHTPLEPPSLAEFKQQHSKQKSCCGFCIHQFNTKSS